MTKNSDFKSLVRTRMRATGENYTAAHAALSIDRDAARAAHLRRITPFFEAGSSDGGTGRLLQIPARRRTRLAVVLELLERFEPARIYSETEVNAVLRAAHEDVAYLRRELVDYGLLERDSAVGSYWVAEVIPVRTGNLAQEMSDWERVRLPELLGAG